MQIWEFYRCLWLQAEQQGVLCVLHHVNMYIVYLSE